MRCHNCPKELSRQNRSGYCCYCAPKFRPAGHGKRVSEGIRRRLAHDPLYLEAKRAAARALREDPEINRRRTRHFAERKLWLRGNEAQPAGSPSRQRAGRAISEAKMAWCPRELRQLYRDLTRKSRLKAAEARALVLEHHERDMEKFRREYTAATQ